MEILFIYDRLVARSLMVDKIFVFFFDIENFLLHFGFHLAFADPMKKMRADIFTCAKNTHRAMTIDTT